MAEVEAGQVARVDVAPEVREPAFKRVYLAGPMTGLPELNYPAFHAAAALLRSKGYEVFNPAEHFGGDTSRERTDYMRQALWTLTARSGITGLYLDAIVALPGWADSVGALTELLVAEQCGLPMRLFMGHLLGGVAEALVQPDDLLGEMPEMQIKLRVDIWQEQRTKMTIDQ